MKERKNEIVSAVLRTVMLLLLGIFVLFYCEWRGDFGGTFEACQKLFWVLPIFAVLICMAHYFRGKGRGKDNSPGERKVYLDYARVLAATMVILTHACSMQMGEDAAAWRTTLLTICAGLGLVCNLFVRFRADEFHSATEY